MTKLIDSLTDVLGDTTASSFEVTHFLDTGFPPLNKAISGQYERGFPCGRIVEMFGPPSCGKTAIATKAMISAQQHGGFAMFFDHERSFDINLAQHLGLDVEAGTFAHIRPETLEESFTRAIKAAQKIRDEELIDPSAPIIAVFDSLAAMVPRTKSEKELTELTMADSLALAKATSSVLPAVNQYAEKYNMLALILNQTRENPGIAYGDPTRTPGGKAPGFYASVRVKLSAKPLVNKDKERLGQRITAEVIKTKLTRPFQQAGWDFLFEESFGKFDVIGSMVDYLVEVGALEQKGPRITFEGKSYYRSELINHIEENNFADKLTALLP
jgi:protein RecA